ncbi:MAG: hypothetical protein VKK04_00660 [Synechococcales bacterium]|nr:hypothetical protein [Synechococcales bacterium]
MKHLEPTKLFVAVCLLASVASLSALKGFIPRPQIWGTYFWFITYQFGFTRRGLVGTLMEPWLQGVDPDTAEARLVVVHIVLLLALVGLILVLAGRFIRHTRSVAAAILCAVFLSSHFLTTIAYNGRYPDPLIAVLLVLMAIALERRARLPMAMGLLIIGTLMHEMFLIFACPLILFGLYKSHWQPQSRFPVKKFAQVLVIFLIHAGLMALLIVRAETPSSQFMAIFQNAGISEDVARTVLEVQLSQGTGEALSYMAAKWQINWMNGILASIYSLFPSGVMLLIYWTNFSGDRPPFKAQSNFSRTTYFTLFLFSCYGCLSILALAWDLSRFLQFANLTTLLTCVLDTLIADCPTAERDSWALPHQDANDPKNYSIR